MGLKNTSSVIPHEKLHVSLLQEIQDLEDRGDRLVFSLDDGRQSLLLDYFQSDFCRAQVRVHFRVEIVDGFFVVLVLARTVQGTEA